MATSAYLSGLEGIPTESYEEELRDVSQRSARQCLSCTYGLGLVVECFSRILNL